MPFLLADSFGQLGQEDLAEDQNRRIAMAGSVGAAMQGLQFGVRSQQAQRAQDLAEAQSEYEYGPEGQPELGLRGQELAQRKAEMKARADEAKSRDDIARDWVKIGQQQVDQQKVSNPTQARNQDLEYNRGLMNAQAFGAYDNEDEVGAIHPTLTPGQRTAIALVSQNTRKQKESEFDAAANTAAVLNKRDQLKTQLADLGTNPTSQAPTSGWFTSDNQKAKNQAIAKALTDWKTIAPKAARIEADKRLNTLITYDPESNSYQPVMPPPPWRGSASAASAPTGAASHAPRPAAPVQTTGTGTSAQKYDPWVYGRVRELIGAGVPPVQAKRNALQEWSEAQAQGNTP